MVRPVHGVESSLGKKWAGCGLEIQMTVDSHGDGLGVDLLEVVGMGCRWAIVAVPVGLGLGVGTQMDLTWFGWMRLGWGET